jgi:hypothetical protein
MHQPAAITKQSEIQVAIQEVEKSTAPPESGTKLGTIGISEQGALKEEAWA